MTRLWLLAVMFAAAAQAHSMNQSALMLDFRGRSIDLEWQIPAAAVEPAEAQNLADKLIASLPDGRKFSVRMAAPPHLTTLEGTQYLVARLTLALPDATLFDLDLRFPDQVTLVSIRSDWVTSTFANEPQLIGVLQGSVHSVRVDRRDSRWMRGFASIFRLGMRHIAEGTDHLLFLLALLLPAPLLVKSRRWGGFAGARHSLLQIFQVVTAFTIGHSATLAASALGVVKVPSRPIEILIAVSILISALHALRPLFPGREALIAGSFGLIHGFAFASTLAELGLGRWDRVASIFGFNLGIEAMQIVVVAATMPSLLLLSRSRIYPAVRVSGAVFAGIAAIGWLGERLLHLPNPMNAPVNAVAAHPLRICIGLLLLSLASLSRRPLRGGPGALQPE